jgi:hypothetical protein
MRCPSWLEHDGQHAGCEGVRCLTVCGHALCFEGVAVISRSLRFDNDWGKVPGRLAHKAALKSMRGAVNTELEFFLHPNVGDKMNLAKLGAVGVLVGSTFAFSPPASAGGLIGDFINNYIPGAGTALDDANRRFRDSQSSESFYNQMTGDYWNNPMRAAPGTGPGAPPPSGPMPYCATPAGTFGPLPPPGAPGGTGCWHAFPNGQVVNGQVIWG